MSYKMPQCYRGQIVRWYDGGVKDDARATPAIVLVENHSSLHLKVFGLDGDFQKECVRHVADPGARELEKIDQGGWDFTEIGPQSPPYPGDAKLSPVQKPAK